jgi:tetratricopeptide (TPR) repeat protein
MIRNCLFFFLSIAIAAAQGWPPVMSFQSARTLNRDDADYQKGLHELDEHHWDRAVAAFKASADRDRSSRDAALYWEAYAQNRAGRDEEALATLSTMLAQYPSSSWVRDAMALQLEMRGQAGAPSNPSTQGDEELKLLAINNLMQSDPDQAVPILQKLLKSNASEKLKDRALFVLTQSSSPAAAATLEQVAHDSSNPALQRKAIRYMGMMGKLQVLNELASIYKASSDVQLKREILRSFMMRSGSRDFLLDIAKTEQNPELRRDAIRQLAIVGGQEQLRQLYNSVSSVEDKKTILNALAIHGADAEWLEQIYKTDQNAEIRHAVLNALFLQQNGKVLIDLARNEKDPKWKQDIVQKMSLIHSKEVTDYMLEVLK